MQTQIKILDSSLSEEQVLWPVQRDYQLILSTEEFLLIKYHAKLSLRHSYDWALVKSQEQKWWWYLQF